MKWHLVNTKVCVMMDEVLPGEYKVLCYDG